ncbi:hypothetical protein [Blastopirellula marina]|uniref:LTXXQ motif protein n=1 Tax=Blastopirellula marina TaxID=124 RepID=A0A2S8FWC9_9BACT|nr:hypothetical protein [Blastopirellula marina]PQO36485.1 hypothetical protein C5Y98_12350 [Blastopirellula marina]PQO47435.1 hypothetical protein C5Y93_05165 [Blastopirellula marina]PTL44322.1 hypothetical protein C5Y97_12360 [Blastopirellula marina]
MKNVIRTCLILTFAVLVAMPVLAADKAEKKEKKAKGPANAGVFAVVNKIELTDKQKEQVAALKKEFGSKLAEANKAVALTDEQKAARKTATQEVKDKGLKGKEAREYVMGKVNLSSEQQEAQKELGALTQVVRTKLIAILTPEQKEAAGIKDAPVKKKKEKEAK